jgi:enterochelin esterase-like enzyme
VKPLVIAFAALLSGCEGFRTQSWELAPLGETQLETKVLTTTPAYTVERVRYYSKEMKSPRFFLAIVPKSDQPLQDVMILNHGWFDRPEMLLREIKVDGVYTKLLAQKKVRPAIVIVPDVRLRRFNPQEFQDHPFPIYLTLFAEELPAAIARKYSIPMPREHWGMGGFSYGGLVSIDSGRHYPGRFSSISVVSSFFDSEWTFWPDKQPAAVEKAPGRNTIVNPGPVPRLLLACGTSDRFIDVMTTLHHKLSTLGFAHQWSTAPGGHTWEYWASVLPTMFEFHLPPKPEIK